MQGPQNSEIRATLAVSQTEALSGTTRVLTLPGGRQVPVTIPPGSYTGRELRVPTSPNQNAETLIITLAITADEHPASPPTIPAGPYGATPPPPPASGPRPSGQYAQYQFSEYVPGSQVPYPVPSSPQQYFSAPSSAQAGTAPPYAQSYPMYGAALAGQVPPPPTQPRERKRSPLLYSLLIFTILFLIIASSLFYLFGFYVPNLEHTHATATAQVRTAGTTQAQATATGIVSGTATTEANATATFLKPYIDSYQKATSGTPTLNDDLQAPSVNNWETGPYCTFKNGSYHIIEQGKGYYRYCLSRATNFSNFAYQVQMTIIQGDYGGLVFRANREQNKLYLLRISPTGEYVLYYYPSAKGDDAQTLTKGTSPTFKPGYNTSNQLTVIAKGNNIDLYINSQYVTSVQENSLGSGQVGLTAEYENTSAEVAYSQAKVWQL